MAHGTTYRRARGFRLNPCRGYAVALLLTSVILSANRAWAQIQVNGVVDRTVYTDSVVFTVVGAVGFDYTNLLNGTPVAVDTPVDVTTANYYELDIERRDTTSGATENQLLRFIVRASERGNSEWGLPPWVPYPSIPSAAAEFIGAQLQIVTPQDYPQGLPIPVVSWVLDSIGNRVGVNGSVTAAEFPDQPLHLLRGVGSTFLPSASAEGLLTYTGTAHSLSTEKQINIESSNAWDSVSGTISVDTTWSENARVDVVDALSVVSGVTLTVERGAVVRLAAGVDVEVNGRLVVNGTLDQPVVFTPTNPSAPWGGLLFRTTNSVADITGAIFTGSGANPNWFNDVAGSGSSHRDEQALIYLSGGATATLNDCSLIDLAGQAGHGESSFLTLNRCLVQRCTTTGQFNAGSVVLNDSALIEFPAANAPFADDDNDAIYFTGGAHILRNSLVGWALDDGIDAGSGSGGTVEVTGCWIESCYHEAMAWSRARLPTVRDSVTINSGQGIECGFGDPTVDAANCLSTANVVGTRFGDNYDWDYNGFLTVTGSLLLFNQRDIWGQAWDDWSFHLAQIDVQNNFVTMPNANHPNNTLWDPSKDSAQLVPFLPTPATQVGVGFAVHELRFSPAETAAGLPVRLSTFTTSTVTVDYEIDTPAGVVSNGTLTFVAGETVQHMPVDVPNLGSEAFVRVRLTAATNGELTGITSLTFSQKVTVIPSGAVWKYVDSGTNLFTAWRFPDYNDDSWAADVAELGYGDGNEATTIEGGPTDARYPTVYFRHHFQIANAAAFDSLTVRLMRDDGGVVYLNGTEIFRSGMPNGEILYSTEANNTATNEEESTFFAQAVFPTLLVDGNNVIAVEIHQTNATSSDISFDLELVGTQTPSVVAPEFIRADANDDGSLDVADPVRILLALFDGQTTDCADALDANDDGSMNIADAVYALNYLFISGPIIPQPFPLLGIDPTLDALGCQRS